MPRPLFRGHSRISYKLESSINRISDTNKKQQALQKIEVFNRYIDSQWEPARNTLQQQGVHEAIAQHYTLKTNLLDCSSDPSVAIYFSCHGRSSTGEQGAMIILPIENALEHGLQCVLAPPYVERIYLQHGVFVHPASSNGTISKELYDELRFPIDKEFEVFQSGNAIDILHDQEEIRRVVNFVNEFVDKGEVLPEDGELQNKLFEMACAERKINIPGEIFSEPELWSQRIAPLLFYLVTYLVGNRIEINDAVVASFVESNRRTIEILIQDYERFFPTSNVFLRDALTILRAALGRHFSGAHSSTL